MLEMPEPYAEKSYAGQDSLHKLWLPVEEAPVRGQQRSGATGEAREMQGTGTDLDQVLRERGAVHGEFTDVAKYYNALQMVIYNNTGGELDLDMRLALEMICQKIARILSGNPNHLDHWVDIAGYAKLVADRLQRDAA